MRGSSIFAEFLKQERRYIVCCIPSRYRRSLLLCIFFSFSSSLSSSFSHFGLSGIIMVFANSYYSLDLSPVYGLGFSSEKYIFLFFGLPQPPRLRLAFGIVIQVWRRFVFGIVYAAHDRKEQMLIRLAQ